ncbi:cation-dependent mannose-6-phosphate receptor-like isoform X2 [Ptychodera flava]|uniref:cation-dependent mannose-6-phosphate receptor-like isoform X2 n=1 Tax=Ptychodera flava TaxID=63121 RepID=UPI003969BC50
MCPFDLTLCLHHLTDPGASAQCAKKSSCSCTFSNGSWIDLQALGYKDGTARFPDTPASGETFLYSYNPCYPFSIVGADNCKDVAMCQTGQAGQTAYYDLGDQNSAKFIENAGKLAIQYAGVTGGITRTSTVNLVCGQGETTFIAFGEDQEQPTFYNFELKSPECCAKAGSSGLSAGTILCIIFLCLVSVYLIGGVLYLKFVKHEEGVNLIPNGEFWMELPALIKDGFLFAISPCRKNSAYSEI